MRTTSRPTFKPLETFLANDGVEWQAETYFPLGTKNPNYWLITLHPRRCNQGTGLTCTTLESYELEKTRLCYMAQQPRLFA